MRPELSTVDAAALEYEYVWFAGQPVAQFTVSNSEAAWYFNDHLGTPLIQTSSTGTVLWRAEYDPYGRIHTLRTGAGSVIDSNTECCE